MKEFDEQYMTQILAMHEAMGLDSKDDAEIRIWHLLRSMLEFCDAQQPRIDFDLLLENVREDFASERLSEEDIERQRLYEKYGDERLR